jgi:molybdopterin/thiamine biosynthesis adenylyltransferase
MAQRIVEKAYMSDYDTAFSRNIGLVDPEEQEILRKSCVAIPGLGGVGSNYAVTLARMGIGKFHISDFDVFELPNFNRQEGSSHSNLHKPKTEVIRNLILDINPEAEITVFPEGVNESNIDAFLEGVDVVADGIDFYALDARRFIANKALEKKIPLVTSGPAGFTATLHVFTPESMSFEEYFDFASCKTDEERLAAFMAGISPGYLTRGQMRKGSLRYDEKRAPSVAPAPQLCTGMLCTQIFLLLVGRECHFLAPKYLQFDAITGRVATRKLRMGNKSLLQWIKRFIALRLLRGSKTERRRVK